MMMPPVSFFLYKLTTQIIIIIYEISTWSFSNSKIYYIQSRHLVIVWNLSPAFLQSRLTWLSILWKLFLRKYNSFLSCFCKTRDSYEVCN